MYSISVIYFIINLYTQQTEAPTRHTWMRHNFSFVECFLLVRLSYSYSIFFQFTVFFLVFFFMHTTDRGSKRALVDATLPLATGGLLCVCVCVCVCVRACVCMCVCVFVRVHGYRCMYTFTYVYIHILSAHVYGEMGIHKEKEKNREKEKNGYS